MPIRAMAGQGRCTSSSAAPGEVDVPGIVRSPNEHRATRLWLKAGVQESVRAETQRAQRDLPIVSASFAPLRALRARHKHKNFHADTSARAPGLTRSSVAPFCWAPAQGRSTRNCARKDAEGAKDVKPCSGLDPEPRTTASKLHNFFRISL